ncbi:MAG: metal-dependent transcriptional regulator [Porphyromonas sp.]|nr:metal-dependent transcriptional regulator [Porphyromonas sp.]
MSNSQVRHRRSPFHFFFSPRRRLREIAEDMLKLLYHYEAEGHTANPRRVRDEIGGSKKVVDKAYSLLLQEGLIYPPLTLSDQGRQRALQLIRRHRLYETYLAEHSGFAPDEWHSQAERVEHCIDREEEERISSILRHPRYDPHGDPIPDSDGAIPKSESQSLAIHIQEPTFFSITHVEDQPEVLFSLMVEMGLAPGVVIRAEAEKQGSLVVVVDGRREVLSPAMRSRISIRGPLSADTVAREQGCIRLSNLPKGSKARIVGLSELCRGANRRRLLDLGFVPGSEVCIDLTSPLGNPTAYLVRGSTIALRKDQAAYIRVKPVQRENRT